MMLKSIATKDEPIRIAPTGRERALWDPELEEALESLGKPDSVQVHLVWDTVWWRKVVYFLTMFFAAALAAYPLTAGLLSKALHLERADQASRGIVSSIVDAVSGLLPSQLSAWVDALTAHPIMFAAFALGLAACLYFGRLLATRISDRSRYAWRSSYRSELAAGYQRKERAAMRGFGTAAVVFAGAAVITYSPTYTPETFWVFVTLALACAVLGTARVGGRRQEAHVSSTPMLAIARMIRRSAWANGLERFVTIYVWPTLFIGALLYGAAAMVNKVAVDVTAAVGFDCQASRQLSAPAGVLARPFPSKDPCWATGVAVEKGVSYRVRIKTDAAWMDRTHESRVVGFETDTFVHAIAMPLKRWIAQNWFAPVARVGRFGNEEYVLKPLGSDKRLLVAEFTPKSNGELFLYVNDVMPLFPRQYFYDNNQGVAQVSVEAKPEP